MSFKRLIFIVTFVGVWGFCNAQNSTLDQLQAFFQPAKFEVMHLHARQKKLTGKKIDAGLVSLIKSALNESTAKAYYGIYRFSQSTSQEAFIVRLDFGNYDKVYYMVYDLPTRKFIPAASRYLIDNSLRSLLEIETQSWILDINNDGHKDLVSQQWSDYALDEGMTIVRKMDVYSALWDKKRWINTKITQPKLKAQIQKQLPFFKGHYLTYDVETSLSKYIKAKAKIQSDWWLMAASDRDLPNAQYELKRARKLFGKATKYQKLGLAGNQFKIYKRGNRYYTLVHFKTETAARKALKTVQQKFNPTAFVVAYRYWCPEFDKENECYECK